MSTCPQDNGRPSISRKSGERKSSGQYATRSAGSLARKTCQKPWPAMQASGNKELVKHMSDVPDYLQNMDMGDSSQERALNFGVLDWGLLEKWAYNQRLVAAGKVRDSPSTSNASSVFSPSSQSSKSTSNSLSSLKQTASKQSVQSSQAHTVSKENHKCVVSLPDTRTSSTDIPVDIFTNNALKENPKDGRMSFLHAKRAQDGRSREFKNFESYEKQKIPIFYLNSNKTTGTILAHHQGSVHRRGASFESIEFDVEDPKAVNRKSYSGEFPSEDARFTGLSPSIPRSCPLLRGNRDNELSGPTELLHQNVATTAKSSAEHQSYDKFTAISSELFKLFMAEESDQKVVKASTAARRREFTVDHQGGSSASWFGRTCSVRQRSSIQQTRSVASSDSSHADKATPNDKGRRSPLRRLLDPLVKPKNCSTTAGRTRLSAIQHSHEQQNSTKPPLQEKTVDEAGKSGNLCMHSSFSMNSSSHVVPLNSLNSTLDGKHVPSTKQALLQLVWKNDHPLFMFSCNDNDTLAATVRREGISNKDGLECIYNVLSVHEVRKKNGIWSNQVNKSKNHEFVSTVVGQIKVFHSELADCDSRHHVPVREFVLFGAEFVPTSHEHADPVFNKELAAVIVKVSKDDGYSDQSGILQTEQDTKYLNSIIAILPSGIHGASSAGEPSPLIERWKSGGLCDCGGWDEGCMLTILCNKVQENMKSVPAQACSTMNDPHQIEMIALGGAQRNKYTLTMVAFREGLYTVDFGASITLLQTFVICIATLHCRNSPAESKVCLLEAKSSKENVVADNPRPSVRKYMEHPTRCHPPVSPIRRA